MRSRVGNKRKGLFQWREMPDAFIETYHRIVTEFFPQSTQYEYAENVEFEVYLSADTSNPNYQCEIWIAVNERQE